MKVVVTGGAGYIGSITVEQLIATGAEVVVFDDLSLGHREAVHPQATLVVGDLADRAAVDALMAEHRPDAVMHFASRSQVGESMREPFLYVGDNVRNGLNLIESMVAHDVKRFILSSTAALFAEPTKIPIDEQERIIPGSPYGESKHILERILHWAESVYGMRYAFLRYFNAAGASEERGEHHDPETHLIPLVLQVAQGRRDSITVFGNDYPTPDGTCLRDYIHVIDLAAAHILALGALEERSRIYNLGNGTGFSVMEVIETARAVTGHPIPRVMGERRPGDPPALSADSTKIRAELGWTPQYPTLEAIVRTAWAWHSAHPHGY
ncbi:MAG: UDP-glucose 4-epimerase GalE [Nannocystaceae bacterium]|nr:UDP-glucose 4-epimerase GalE [bacterium]